jgi:uncharacterized protein with HEPN domain
VSAQARKYLWDIAQAAELIARFTAERGFDDYLADAMLRAAVERQFTIVGEATVTLRRLDPALAAAIPDLAKIIAFRNILVHGYATVDNHVVWGIVERQLAVLRSTVERLIRDIDSKGTPNSPDGTV